jgi:hypothetical protein
MTNNNTNDKTAEAITKWQVGKIRPHIELNSKMQYLFSVLDTHFDKKWVVFCD